MEVLYEDDASILQKLYKMHNRKYEIIQKGVKYDRKMSIAEKQILESTELLETLMKKLSNKTISEEELNKLPRLYKAIQHYSRNYVRCLDIDTLLTYNYNKNRWKWFLLHWFLKIFVLPFVFNAWMNGGKNNGT